MLRMRPSLAGSRAKRCTSPSSLSPLSPPSPSSSTSSTSSGGSSASSLADECSRIMRNMSWLPQLKASDSALLPNEFFTSTSRFSSRSSSAPTTSTFPFWIAQSVKRIMVVIVRHCDTPKVAGK